METLLWLGAKWALHIYTFCSLFFFFLIFLVRWMEHSVLSIGKKEKLVTETCKNIPKKQQRNKGTENCIVSAGYPKQQVGISLCVPPHSSKIRRCSSSCPWVSSVVGVPRKQSVFDMGVVHVSVTTSGLLRLPPFSPGLSQPPPSHLPIPWGSGTYLLLFLAVVKEPPPHSPCASLGKQQGTGWGEKSAALS